MDYLRSCYECDVRFFPGQPDNISRIRWYFADGEALRLPYRHRFGSRNWEQPITEDGSIGELVAGHRRWYSGENFTGHTGQGTSVPEELWFNGCGDGDGLLGTECTPGFWESFRAGFAAYLSARSRVMRYEWKYGPGSASKLVPIPADKYNLGIHFAVRLLVPEGIDRVVVHLGIETVLVELRARELWLRERVPLGVQARVGRLGRGFVPRAIRKHGLNAVPRGGGGPIRKAVPPPAGFAPIIKGPRKVLVAIPPAVGVKPVVRVPRGKRFASSPCICLAGLPYDAFRGAVELRSLTALGGWEQLEGYGAGVVLSSVVSSGAWGQSELYAGAVSLGSAASSGAWEQSERFTGAVSLGSITSSGAYTDTSGVLLSYTGAVTLASLTSAGVYREFATTGSCSACNPAATKFTFTMSGLTNGLCTLCSANNGTFIISYTTGCTWNDAFGGCAAAAHAQHDLVITGSGATRIATLTVYGAPAAGRGTGAVYTLTGFDCVNGGTLSLVTSGTSCNGWPATVTLTPTR